MAGVGAGVTVEQFSTPGPVEFKTGIAGFIGHGVGVGARPATMALASWHQLPAFVRASDATWQPDDVTWHAIQGYFANGGSRCVLVAYDHARADDPAALADAIDTLGEFDEVDVVCAPALMNRPDATALQLVLLDRAQSVRDDWFLILDAPQADATTQALLETLASANIARRSDVALYHPWVVPGGDIELPDGTRTSVLRTNDSTLPRAIPPSGHVAGAYARSDERVGVHKPPANELLEGVIDTAAFVGELAHANSIRAFPGRGIRVWGARTLSPGGDADLASHVNVRRLTITLRRWLERALAWTAFEANDLRLWIRVRRELDAKLADLFARGALAGRTPEEAFYVKCDEENNPADLRATGVLCVDVGIAPMIPKEHIHIRLVRNTEQLTAT